MSSRALIIKRENPREVWSGSRWRPACEAGVVTVWLLVGLTGSGKTTFARRLEAGGVVRLSTDEEVFSSFQVSHETPPHTYLLREEAT
jgi:tRNA A37 threonylcarbamoyladenosine biosynthesis protein TsaE